MTGAAPTTLDRLPVLPALVEGTVSHTRPGPVQHRFAHRVYQWLVDLDDLPAMGWPLRAFSGFAAADHLGDPARTLRENVDRYCALHDVDLTGGRVVMLANARVLGHTFDPLSVFWCFDATGRLAAVLAEVHNTYDERHVYLLPPSPDGAATVDKAFYVSPFLTVEGTYDLRLELGRDHVRAQIVLRQDDAPVFGATFEGTPRPAGPARLARLLLRRPLMTQRVSALIRLHGVWLWLRRLPVVPRRPHRTPEGVR